MRIEILRQARLNERFAANAFDGQIGKTIPLGAGIGAAVLAGVLVAAQVVDAGTAVRLTIDIQQEADCG